MPGAGGEYTNPDVDIGTVLASNQKLVTMECDSLGFPPVAGLEANILVIEYDASRVSPSLTACCQYIMPQHCRASIADQELVAF
jgi:hypothetical protein